MIASLNHYGINFPVSRKSYHKIGTKNIISIKVFGFENQQAHLNYLSKEKFENHMEFLLI